jgi:DNA polymerase-3 subunit delta
MKLTTDNLPAHLERQLLPAYLISGDEPLLAAEAADAIRGRARAQGFSERQVYFAERGFDWNALRTEGQSLSLFAERRIIELKLPTGKPGEGAEVLEEFVRRRAPDQLLLVLSGKIDRTTQKSAWVQAFERHGGWIQVWPVEAARLPAWIAARMRQRGLKPDTGAAALLAERVEGNLLAARQEIDKLALLLPPGPVDVATLAQVVADSARYDVFQLADAVLAGDGRRALRILQGLRGEGAEPPLVLWSLCRALRSVWRELQGAGKPAADLPYWLQKQQVHVTAAARRLGKPAIPPLIKAAARADRTIKGRLRGDPWDAMTALVARFAGVRL